MYNFVLLVFMLLPLTGVFLMEQGAYSPDLYIYGYKNGATLAYAIYTAVILITYFVLRRRVFQAKSLERVRSEQVSDAALGLLAKRVIIMHVITLVFVLFVAGTISVVTGQVGRGELRVSIGPAALPAFFVRDFFVPGTAALVGLMYTLSKKTKRGTIWVSAVLFTTILHGLVWGYRGLVVFMLIPMGLLALPKVRIRSYAIALVVCTAGVVVATSFYEDLPLSKVPARIIQRATVQTGGVAWRMWGLAEEGAEMPPFWKTLVGFLGNRIPVMVGLIDPNSQEDITNSDWSATLFSIAYGKVSGYEQTSNLTGTTFSEAIDAFGSRGFLFYAVIVGIIIAIHRTYYDKAMLRGNAALLAVLSVYFSQSIVAWLNSGGVISLFHIVLVADYFVLYFILVLLLRAAHLPTRFLLAAPPGARTRWGLARPASLAPVRLMKKAGA